MDNLTHLTYKRHICWFEYISWYEPKHTIFKYRYVTNNYKKAVMKSHCEEDKIVICFLRKQNYCEKQLLGWIGLDKSPLLLSCCCLLPPDEYLQLLPVNYQRAPPVLPVEDAKEDGNHEEPRQLSLKAASRVSNPERHLIVNHPHHDDESWLPAWTRLDSSKARSVP